MCLRPDGAISSNRGPRKNAKSKRLAEHLFNRSRASEWRRMSVLHERGQQKK
jgi:hypothetical protein